MSSGNNKGILIFYLRDFKLLFSARIISTNLKYTFSFKGHVPKMLLKLLSIFKNIPSKYETYLGILILLILTTCW